MARRPARGISLAVGVGAVTAGETYGLLLPDEWAGDGTVPLVLFLHGSGGSALSGTDRSFYYGEAAIPARLAQAGYPVLSCDWGGPQTWGNTPMPSRLNDGIAFGQGPAVGAKPGKVPMLAVSMGGNNALNYAAANPSKVSCLSLIAPVSDLDDIHTRNPGGAIAGLIDSAYSGGWSQATYGATNNPITLAQAGKFAGLPIQLWQGLQDTTVLPANTAALAAACNNSTVTYLAGGHAESTWAEVDPGRVIQFIAQNTNS